MIVIVQNFLYITLFTYSHKAAPAPDRYLYKYDFDKKENTLEIFMAAGSLNGKWNAYSRVHVLIPSIWTDSSVQTV